jgi:CheY-like chemotaxis protein
VAARPPFAARNCRVSAKARESLWVVALVHPESLPAAGLKGHDISRAEFERLWPLKFQLHGGGKDPKEVHKPMSEVRILIADDSLTVRTGLKMLLELHPEWQVCGEAEDGRDAVKKAAELHPDVILLDISMPAMDGLTAAELIRRDAPEAEILIVTHFESLDLARYAAQAGVRGYIAKSRIATDLERAIKAAAQHQSP